MFEKDPRKAFEQKLLSLGEQNKKIVTVSTDSAKGAGMSSFVKAFPDRHFEIGISEQAAVSICAGLAEIGLIPVISAITPFLTMRAYEQMRNDVGYANMNVKVFGSGAGLAYSTLGSSHAVTEDIAVMRSIPNMIILNPGDSNEVEASLELAIKYKGPVYIRMFRQVQGEILPKQEEYVIGRSNTLREGKDAIILATGVMINPSLKAVEILKKKGLSVAVESYLTVHPVDETQLLNITKYYPVIFAIEEHSKVGGFGSLVCDILIKERRNQIVEVIGIEKNNKVGPYDELQQAHGLSPEKIAERVERILKY